MKDLKHIALNAFKESSKVKKHFIEHYVDDIVNASHEIVKRLKKGGHIFFMGNGGSAADAQHLVAELVGRFYQDRAPIPAFSLSTNSSILTEIPNDFDFSMLFARQIEADVNNNDVVIGISTSGRSRNIINGINSAKEKGALTIGFTGGDGGEMDNLCDILFVVPSEDTPRIQETHITLGHTLCQLIESEMFEDEDI
ncbi:MAG: phosphoheptose isomerase [Thermotoga sp.]|nr:MAG: phosphoheptose isomerase [Thermotoga sp.]